MPFESPDVPLGELLKQVATGKIQLRTSSASGSGTATASRASSPALGRGTRWVS